MSASLTSGPVALIHQPLAQRRPGAEGCDGQPGNSRKATSGPFPGHHTLSRWTGLFLGLERVPGREDASRWSGRQGLGLSLLPQQVETHLWGFPRPSRSGQWVSGPQPQSWGPAEARRGGAQPGSLHGKQGPPSCAHVPMSPRHLRMRKGFSVSSFRFFSEELTMKGADFHAVLRLHKPH